MRVRAPPIAIGRNVPTISRDLKPVNIGLYKPKINSRLEGLSPGTRMPKAIKAPASIKVMKLAGSVPMMLFRK